MTKRKRIRRGSIPGAWTWRSIEMLESPAYRALSLSAHRILARLEIELHQHGGKPEENGKLACTFEHFVEYGIERHAVARAIRETVALGFVEITRQGCAGNAGYRQPTLYRVTYRHTGSDKRITDEWRNIAANLAKAKAIARGARPKPPARPKIKSPVRKKPLTPVRKKPLSFGAQKATENGKSPVGVLRTTSISRVGSTVRADTAGRTPDGPRDAPEPPLRLAHDADRQPTLSADDGVRLPFPNPAKG